jgi:hypothetical protein
MTTETPYSPEDVLRAHNAEMSTSSPPPESGYSEAVMKMFRRAKKASTINDERSRRIVASQNKERAEKRDYKPILPHTDHSQSNIMDF